MMAQSRAESTRDIYNYGQYINQFPPNTIKAIRQYEQIQKKICRQKMSIMFNEICINEELLPKYTYIYIYIYREREREDLALIKNKGWCAIKVNQTKSYIFDIYVWRGLGIKSSSSSCRAASTDIPDPLPPLLPITHRLWQVFRTTSRILT